MSLDTTNRPDAGSCRPPLVNPNRGSSRSCSTTIDRAPRHSQGPDLENPELNGNRPGDHRGVVEASTTSTPRIRRNGTDHVDGGPVAPLRRNGRRDQTAQLGEHAVAAVELAGPHHRGHGAAPWMCCRSGRDRSVDQGTRAQSDWLRGGTPRTPGNEFDDISATQWAPRHRGGVIHTAATGSTPSGGNQCNQPGERPRSRPGWCLGSSRVVHAASVTCRARTKSMKVRAVDGQGDRRPPQPDCTQPVGPSTIDQAFPPSVRQPTEQGWPPRGPSRRRQRPRQPRSRRRGWSRRPHHARS